MVVFKYLLASAFLCSAGMLTRVAVTQEPPEFPDPVQPVEGQLQDPNATSVDVILSPVTRKETLTTTTNTAQTVRGFQFSNDRVPEDPDRFTRAYETTSPPVPPTENMIREYRMLEISAEEREAFTRLRAAMTVLKSSKEESARKQATETIQEQLNVQFERDLKQREKELADVEARVKALREQLDRRKAAREEIIGLRLKTVINDADGLGFPGTEISGDVVRFPGGYGGPPALPFFPTPSAAPKPVFRDLESPAPALPPSNPLPSPTLPGGLTAPPALIRN